MAEFSCICVKERGTLKILARESFDRAVAAFGEGEEVELTLGPLDLGKTRKQECGFHAMIQPWAKEDGHAIEDLKQDLLREVFGLKEHTDVVTGEVVMVLRKPHTSKLTKAEYSELIDRTLEIAARCGYVLTAPQEYHA